MGEKVKLLADYQLKAVNKMKNGCILNGGVGSGKSRTGIYYYFKEQGGLYSDKLYKMKNPKDLYIITTAAKRDKLEFDYELSLFGLSKKSELNTYKNKVIIDSWNNIKKYEKICGAFFIFDEDRVTGSGVWVKAFYKIAKNNNWIILSATPGDTWEQYIPVFIANGFFKNKTEFIERHVIYDYRCKAYPKVDRYVGEGRLIRLRNNILIDMDCNKHSIQHHNYIFSSYNRDEYKNIIKTRWDPYKNQPISDAAGLCYILRKLVNSDQSRIDILKNLCEEHRRIIVFYNYDYELDILKSNDFYSGNTLMEKAEWNGHKHQPIPKSNCWIYFVQYLAGCEGWNCIETDTIVFYSQTYSYKMLNQACGRIDRLNTPYEKLYYYHIKSKSGIDLAISKALSEKKKFNEMRWVHDYNIFA